jgi:ABC-type dipeptide/oligopeptide/nickel transport system permease component
MIMLSLFCVTLQIFPCGRNGKSGMAFADMGTRFLDILHHLILPVITMSIL